MASIGPETAADTEYGVEGTNWHIRPYDDFPLFGSIARGVGSALELLPHAITLFSFKSMLALPPSLNSSPLYWLTQPEYEDLSRWSEIVTDKFTGGLMRLKRFGPLKRADATIIYVHGGAGIVGHARMFSSMYRDLLQAIEGIGLGTKERRAQVLSVEYSLANPQNRLPKQQDEVTAAYRFLISQGVQPESIILAGDSAGALFATRAMLDYHKRYSTDMHLAGTVLISPWADVQHEYAYPSWTSPKTSSDIITASFLEYGTRQLSGSNPSTDLKTYSPAHASKDDLARLPPTIVTVGDAEKLADSIRNFSSRLKDCKQIELAGGCHDWICKKTLVEPGSYAERDQHIKEIAEWIAERVGWDEVK